jgi:hypothetical protein
LPHRVDRHARGNAAEALLVFAWLSDLLELSDCTEVLIREADLSTAFAQLVEKVLRKLGVTHESA